MEAGSAESGDFQSAASGKILSECIRAERDIELNVVGGVTNLVGGAILDDFTIGDGHRGASIISLSVNVLGLVGIKSE